MDMGDARLLPNRLDGDASPVIARSSCDEAIQGPRDAAPGLLRCARNDGWGVGSFIFGRRLSTNRSLLATDPKFKRLRIEKSRDYHRSLCPRD